jgi:hypothetical protein
MSKCAVAPSSTRHDQSSRASPTELSTVVVPGRISRSVCRTSHEPGVSRSKRNAPSGPVRSVRASPSPREMPTITPSALRPAPTSTRPSIAPPRVSAIAIPCLPASGVRSNGPASAGARSGNSARSRKRPGSRSVRSNVPSSDVTTPASNVGALTHANPLRISRIPLATTLCSVTRAPATGAPAAVTRPRSPGSVRARTSIRDSTFDGSNGPAVVTAQPGAVTASVNACAGSLTLASPPAWSCSSVRPSTRPSAARSSTA